MKRLRLVLSLAVLLAGCGDSTGPTASSWATGMWVAVRANGLPLPFQDRPTYPWYRSDSLVVFIFDPPQANGHARSVFPYAVSSSSPLVSPTPINCYDSDVNVAVTETTITTWAKGSVTTGSGCNASFVTLRFTRKGDSLAGTWNGADVRLVKR